MLSGELHEDEGSAGFVSSPETVSTQSLDDLLSANGEFRAARLLKIDTDGFDSHIIRGALPWLRAQRPVLFWECDPVADAAASGCGIELFHDLREAGYATFTFFANSGEVVCGCKATDNSIIEDLYRFLYRRSHMPYADVCAVSEKDSDLISF